MVTWMNFTTYHANVDDVVALLQNSKMIKTFCLILHDKFSEEEEGESPHIQGLLHLNGSRSFAQIRSIFDHQFSENTFVEETKDHQKAFEYLIHQNNPEKYQFPEDERLDFGYYDEISKKCVDVGEMFNAYLSGEKVTALVSKYGKDFLYHFNQIKAAGEASHEISYAELQQQNERLLNKIADYYDLLLSIASHEPEMFLERVYREHRDKNLYLMPLVQIAQNNADPYILSLVETEKNKNR